MVVITSLNVSLVFAIVMVVVASIFDLIKGRVPNSVSYSGFALGFLFTIIVSEHSFERSLVGAGVGGGLFFIFWLTGGMGAGDVKLMAALGALLGWPRIWDVIFFTALCGAVMAILFLIWRRIPAVATEGSDGKAIEDIPRRKQRMPYAVAIALGTIVALVTG